MLLKIRDQRAYKAVISWINANLREVSSKDVMCCSSHSNIRFNTCLD